MDTASIKVASPTGRRVRGRGRGGSHVPDGSSPDRDGRSDAVEAGRGSRGGSQGDRSMRFNGLRRRALTREAARPGRRRWAQRVLLGLATFAALVVLAVLVLLHDLDHPWLKRRVQAMARASAGLDIDYASVRVALLSGAVVEGLVVQTPAEFRAPAPDLAAVDHLEARWSPGSLFGRGPAIEQLTISGV